jgi:predicted nucleotide-binding protein
VVLELGYFMAALGRSRIAVVHEPAVEMPSNFDGVVYISKDADWKSKLSVELDAAKVGNAEVSVVE